MLLQITEFPFFMPEYGVTQKGESGSSLLFLSCKEDPHGSAYTAFGTGTVGIEFEDIFSVTDKKGGGTASIHVQAF